MARRNRSSTAATDPLKHLTVPVEGLDLESNRAGSGAYGIVFRVTVRGRPCIAKKLHSILLRAGDYYPIEQKDSITEKFRNECVILSQLHHPNIVEFVGVHYGHDKSDISLIMERLYTDLAAFVHTQSSTPTPERIQILWHVTKGLKYLHTLTPPLIHRDLTAPNIFLSEDLVAKIGDLGVSRYIDPNSATQVLSKAPGNVYYMPPETREENPKYTDKLDIFSFGTLIMHTFIGRVPDLHDVPYSPAALKLSQEGKIEITRRKKAVQLMGEEHCMYPLAAQCLHDNPDNRPPVSAVLESMEDLCRKYPTKERQKNDIRSAMEQSLREGDIWYLVEFDWLSEWKQYVGYDGSPKSGQLGSLRTKNLLSGNGSLKYNLKPETDYSLLPKSAWDWLVAWYGLEDDNVAIPRIVVACDEGLMVEVYKEELCFCLFPNLNTVLSAELSRASTLDTVKIVGKELFNLGKKKNCRIYSYNQHSFELLDESAQTLKCFVDLKEQILVIEMESAGATWPKDISLEQQKAKIEADLASQAKMGEVRYMVSAGWKRHWEKYVIQACEEYVIGKPGPVRNSNLLNKGKLCDNLIEDLDFIALPESAWVHLCFWYGLETGSTSIKRRVISCGGTTIRSKLEVYPLSLNISYLQLKHGPYEVKRRELSRADTIGDVKLFLEREWPLPLSTDFKIWHHFYEQPFVLTDSSLTLQEAGFCSGDTLCFSTSWEMLYPTEVQRSEMKCLLRKALQKGDYWFLVDIRWMKQWKKYVGYDSLDQELVGKSPPHPGPMDNSNLFRDGVLRKHLMDEEDYYLLPEAAWDKMYSWYGLSPSSQAIPRRVVEYGLYMKHCKVEVYLLEFKLCVHLNINNIQKMEFSRLCTVAELESTMRVVFEVPDSAVCRVWHRYMTHTYELLSKPDQSLQDAGLYNGQTIVLEIRNDDGTWPQT